jgi:8-oxo-dGTP diphosphatase
VVAAAGEPQRRIDGVTEQAGGQLQVAAAIITSRLGVLVGRRRDGNPSWTFPSGKIKQDESPEEAAVRETLEETGLRIRVTEVIGQRVHPWTGVVITYVAAMPEDETAATAASEELEVVRWASGAEAGELMPDMAPAVREHIPGEAGPASSG